MSYRRLDHKGRPLPRKGRTQREPAERQESGRTLYHYEIVVTVPAENGRLKYIRRRHWLPDDQAAMAREREMKREAPAEALTWADAYRRWYENNATRRAQTHLKEMDTTFRKWGEAFGVDATLEGTSLAAFSGWLEEQGRGNTGRMAQLRYSHLMAVARWCRQRGYVQSYPFEHAPKPEARTAKRKPAKLDLFHRYYDILPEAMRHMWRLMGLTGMRLSAACNLLEENIDDKARKFVVVTKGGKEVTYRITPAIAEVFAAVRAWKAGRKTPPATGHLFCNQHGSAWNKQSYGQQLRKIAERHKIERVTSHQLRHLAGTLLGEENFSVDVIQAALGHDSRKSSEVYVDQTQKMRDRALATVSKKLSKNDTETGKSSNHHHSTATPKEQKRTRITCPHCSRKFLYPINKKP